MNFTRIGIEEFLEFGAVLKRVYSGRVFFLIAFLHGKLLFDSVLDGRLKEDIHTYGQYHRNFARLKKTTHAHASAPI